MDVHSVEFYVTALAVAIAVMALIFGQKTRGKARDYIVGLELSPDPDDTDNDRQSTLTLTADDNGALTLTRSRLPLRSGETANLVVEVVDDKVRITEKKGVKVKLGETACYNAAATVNFIPERKFGFRFESEITGQWATFSFLNLSGNRLEVELRY